MVRLEVLPKANHHGHRGEQAFYEADFGQTAAWANADAEQFMAGFDVARSHGLAAMDALHGAAALRLHVDEFVTVERTDSPLMAVTILPKRSLRG